MREGSALLLVLTINMLGLLKHMPCTKNNLALEAPSGHGRMCFPGSQLFEVFVRASRPSSVLASLAACIAEGGNHDVAILFLILFPLAWRFAPGHSIAARSER